ncbi:MULTISPECIES: immune inhibitor A domain-containing protein [unclassified Fusibacter]|uniref:immune inhibitor A domain-containing protein n=1 Tax=unclassified Fusibacter TaxID=2624464 RepID=UPI00101102F4|nr:MULTISPECIES: immune inhibitor A domain-containing protein [unclassified Fusibacter]MCK8060615.1 immune inhibitor A [Fusibacter sp. A2]NPE22931.1 peptidase M6 [Fusibacter sp. A1]RXV59998.1 peptidase M6 [Fusibacter sp. A1]
MFKMSKKVLVVTLAIMMIFNMSFVSAMGNDKQMSMEEFAARYGNTIDLTGKLETLSKDEAFIKKIEEQLRAAAANINFDEEPVAEEEADGEFTENFGSKLFAVDFDFTTYLADFKTFTLRSIGDHIEIWVANDLGFAEGDERPAHVITQEQVDEMRDSFESTIYPKDTEFFGTPDSHMGSNAVLSYWGDVPGDYYTSEDGNDKIILLVDNVKDENYFDKNYPFYVAGFFWGTLEQLMDRNIITIDSARWDRDLEDIQGTVAHEFQHLIHRDNDGSEETFINEGMSDFAEYLCLGNHPMGHVNYFLDHPENSLVTWDEYKNAGLKPETLSDYGQAYLLTLYMYEQYGTEFVKALATDGEYQGIAAINHVLDEFGTGIDFEELFRRFSVAVAVDYEESGIYGFETIDVRVNMEAALEADKDGVPAWGADYKVINQFNKVDNIVMDGIDFLPIPPTPWQVVADPLGSDNNVFWGNEGDDKSNTLVFEADLTGLDTATLKFDNFIDIEIEWDFGFVEISTDGLNWTTLTNDNTTNAIDPDGALPIKEKLADGEGFSGYYDDWTVEEFDLTPYAGSKVYINFHYMTDGAYNDTGWFIDNIEIPEIGYMNTSDSTDGFITLLDLNKIEVKYQVTFINEKKALGKGNEKSEYTVLSFDPTNISEAEAMMLKGFGEAGNTYMIVWYAAPERVTTPVEFSYEIIEKSMAAKNKGKGNSKKK